MSKLQHLVQELPGGVSFEMIHIEGGHFMMGSTDDDPDAHSREKPQHPVELSSFYMGKFPVTQEVWRAVAQAAPEFGLPENPSEFKGDQRPVENVSWEDIDQKFLPGLKQLTGRSFRLPTEAEWEYAARGGIYHGEDYLYAGSDKLSEVGWYEKNSDNETKEVGQKYPNQLGLYDMSGNVWEWCQDWRDDQFYQQCVDQGLVKNPCNLKEGEGRVLRGGGCFVNARACRVARRFAYRPGHRSGYFGFRLVLQSGG